MTYTAASQQGAIETFWLHYGELSGCPSLYMAYMSNLVSYKKYASSVCILTT